MKRITLIYAILTASFSFAQSISISNIPEEIELSGPGMPKEIPFTINYDIQARNAAMYIENAAIVVRLFNKNNIAIPEFGEKYIFYTTALMAEIEKNGNASTGSLKIASSGPNSFKFFDSYIIPPSNTLTDGNYYVLTTYMMIGETLVPSAPYPIKVIVGSTPFSKKIAKK